MAEMEEMYDFTNMPELFPNGVDGSIIEQGYLFPDDTDILGPSELPEWPYSTPKQLIAPRARSSLFWLVIEAGIGFDDLTKMLMVIRSGHCFYREIYLPKRDGDKRRILVPDAPLREIQDRINSFLKESFWPASCVFGFSGGSIRDAVRPHLKSGVILCVDCRNAFPSVTHDDVLAYFTSGRKGWYTGSWSYRRMTNMEHGRLSWYVANALADLTTYQERLPQGAPTSPRIFDLVCEGMDRSLIKLASKFGGVYTRYADNIFFSLNREEFPNPIRQAVLRRIEGQRHSGPSFVWHHLRIRPLKGRAQRMLGLNVIDEVLHSTRAFKRKLRLALYHVKWLLDHGQDWEKAWKRLQGQMAFAVIETLPRGLYAQYEELEERIVEIMY